MIWEDIMDAAGEDIKYNPRLIFTPKHKNWRHITMWASPNVVTKIFESLPYEVQKDIYENDREAFEALSKETQERFVERIKRKNYYPDGGLTDPPPANDESESGTLENLKQLAANMVKSPVATMYDTALWAADKFGAPSNVTNFLRDIPNAFKYKLNALPAATLKALIDFAQGNGFTLEESYNYYLHNPSILQKWNTIQPLSNDNGNYSAEEMQVIRDMAGNKSSITNADIRRVSGKYGGQGSISSYITQPDKVVQTSIGQSSGKNGMLHDVYDTNISSNTAVSDNKAYLNKAKNELGFNYFTLRAAMPYIGSTDIMPDEYKIHTYINLNP